MGSILEKKFIKIWQSLKTQRRRQGRPWFKKADTAVSKKLDAYQKALAEGTVGAWSTTC